MSKSDKEIGNIKGKHLPDKEPSKLQPKSDKKDRKHKYRLEVYYTRWIRANKWSKNSLHRTFEEAKKEAEKWCRMFNSTSLEFSHHYRIVELKTDKVLWKTTGAPK